MSTALSDITLAVLAGGSGVRMGRPKAWLTIGDTPILAAIVRRMNWPGPTLLVSAPGVIHPPGFELFDREVVDPVEGLGPLRGILTGLENAATPMLAAITVDMPAVDRPMVAWLVEKMMSRPECDGLMCRTNREGQCQIEPFPAVFRLRAAATISARLSSGRRSVRSLCDEESFLPIDVPAEWPASVWINLNTPGDVAAFESAGRCGVADGTTK